MPSDLLTIAIKLNTKLQYVLHSKLIGLNWRIKLVSKS